jgi:chromate transporter
MDEAAVHTPPPSQRQRVWEVTAFFLRLGTLAFGGPAAHIAMMQDELVRRRKWLSEQQFLDLLGATQLIPGPNSTEMAIHLGYLRAGWPGLLAAGVSFILPAMLIVAALAAVYTRYGATPQAGWLLYGVQPVVIVIIAQALWNLGRRAVQDRLTAGVGAAVLFLYLLGINELGLLAAGGLLVMLVRNRDRRPPGDARLLVAPLAGGLLAGLRAVPFDLSLLFLTFLKIGSVLYGSGYVLLAFLRTDFVLRLGWLSERQLLDAVSIGQVTPGPVFTTATFIGYVLGGLPGAVLATVGIFLPAFVLVALSNPWIPRLRASPWAGALLDGVNVASLGLMAGVTAQLARAALVDLPAVLLAAVAAGLLLRTRVNTTWLVAGGALAGLLLALLGLGG